MCIKMEKYKHRRENIIHSSMEAFAEITADSACNANNLAFTQKYMPRTYSTYKNIIGSIKGGKTI